jgi:hypothetical protein
MSDTSNSSVAPVFTTSTPIPDAPKPAPPEQSADADKTQFSQADVDRIVQSRVAKYADYDDVKAKLASFEDRDKSELDRAAQARDEAIANAAKASRELSIYRAAAKHGVPAEYVDLIDGADDAEIDAKAERVAELAKATAATPVDPFAVGRFTDPGQSPQGTPDEDAVKEAFARQLFKVNPSQ